MKKIFFLFSLLWSLMFHVQAQITNDEFVSVVGSSFVLGNSSYYRESPVKTVSVSSFYMMKNVVTNAEFVTFLNAYQSDVILSGEYTGKPVFEKDVYGILPGDSSSWKTDYPDFPAVNITWFGANEFCKWYSGRLPTEAEWEYAAKGGKNKNTYIFSGNSTASYVAWYSANSGNVNHAVGTKLPNSIGLYDMSGNVYQWCSDWYGRYNDLNVSAQGPAEGVSKVIRGGYRSIGETDLHLTHRESLSPETALNFVGFRMVRDSLVTAVKDVYTKAVAVYPNPFSDKIYLQNAETISIYDVQGKMVFQTGEISESVNLQHLNKGLYLLKISSGSKTSIHKIIKQ